MATLKIVLPKATNTFDFSGIENYPHEDYEYISLGFNIKMVSGTRESVTIYVNGMAAGSLGTISDSYSRKDLSTHYTTFNSNLSNALITAKKYVMGGGGYVDVPIAISEAYIVRDYGIPYLSSFTATNLYVNGYSEISFKGNKYCRGMAGSVDNGNSFSEQAIPGTIVIGTGDNDTMGKMLVPPGCFGEGLNKGRVRGVNHTRIQEEGFDSTYGTATILPTTVNSFEFIDTKPSKDKPISCTWVAKPQQLKYQMKYKLQSSTEVILDEVETTEKQHIFSPSALPEGDVTVSVRIFDGVYWSDWTSTNITTYAFKVTSLEPNGVAQNKDKEITATWGANEPYTEFEFEYSCNQGTNLITGTTETSYVFPADFFGVETVNMRARTYNGYAWSEWKTATFITYGKPETPSLTIQTEYDTATPTFTWESIGQVSYRLQILKDEMLVLDSADVYSSVKEHTFATALENNVVYLARLSIKNQYEYSSDWDTKEFKIVFQELQKPRFDMFGDDRLGRVMFNIYNAEGQTDFSYCELYRREYGESEWTKIATDLELNSMYTDYTCRSGVLYEYKASAVNLTGGYTDSDIALKEVKLRNTMISDTTDHNNYVVLIHNPTKSRTFAKEIHAMQYSGLTAPRFEFGDIKYTSMNISFTVDEKTLNKLLDLYYSNNALLLRDSRGKKLYGNISNEPSVTDDEFMKYTASFPFTETNFNEGVLA